MLSDYPLIIAAGGTLFKGARLVPSQILESNAVLPVGRVNKKGPALAN